MIRSYIIKTFLFGCFCIFMGTSFAQTYYVSSLNGNDTNNGTSTATAWKTIQRVNQSISTLKPGGSVLFERGGVYYGSVIVFNVSSTAGNPITFGAYGTGKAPILSGSKQVTNWVNIGTNLWKANVPESPATINILFIDGKKYYQARFPNQGYRTITNQYSGGMQDNTLNFPDGYWDGATVAFKPTDYFIHRDTVAHSYADGRIDKIGNYAAETPGSGFGFFFLNHINALDTIGEWVHDKANGTLTLYTNKNPNQQLIEYMNPSNGISITRSATANKDCYIHVEDLSFQHYRNYGVYATSGNGLEIRRNTFTNSQNGIAVGGFIGCLIEENTISEMENIGVNVGNLKDSRVHNNVIQRVGTSLDHGWSAGIAMQAFTSSQVADANDGCEITNNRIDDTGYNGMFITFAQNLLIKNNVINNSMLCLSDGGGIYVHVPSNLGFKNNKIIDNIIMNTIGNSAGTPSEKNASYWRHGIYLDETTSYFTVQGNTVVNSGGGIFFHGAHHNTVQGNVLYNNSIANFINQDNIVKENMLITGDNFQHNYMYQNEFPMYYMSIRNMDIFLNSNQIDNNYISAPFSSTFARMYSGGNANSRVAWSERTNFDLHSKAEPVSYAASGAASPEEFAILVYNPTTKDSIIHLNHTYMSFDNVVYAGSIKLAPFKSAILFRCKKTEETPVAIITTQPVGATVNEGDSYTLNVTATNATGYLWQKWDGAAWSNIPGATGANYTIGAATPLDAGDYRVMVSGANNTVTSMVATVTVHEATVDIPETGINIPGIFTPNGDGYNDTWEIPGIERYPDVTISIYNRAKKLMVELKGTQLPWDGRGRNGNLLESGYYLYQVRLTKVSDVIPGFVTILR